jgi:hypothetical protein
VKDLHRPNDVSSLVSPGFAGDGNGDPVTVLMMQVNLVFLDRLSGLKGSIKQTNFLAAKRLTFGVDVPQKIVVAESIQDGSPVESADLLRAPVPIKNFPIAVHEIDAIRKTVQQTAMKVRIAQKVLF